MGIFLFKSIQVFTQKPQQILILGQTSSGKTTLLKNLTGKKIIQTQATMNFYIEEVIYNNYHIISWDTGGSSRLRQLWRHYFVDSVGLIYLFDSSDPTLIAESKDDLKFIFSKEMKGKPLLIFNNKEDISVLSAQQLVEQLNITKEIQGVKQWKVQGSCALNGDGIQEGLEWLKEVVS